MSRRSPTPRTLILFDVDGVLLHPVGYKEAMRATVNHFAAQMGQPGMAVTDDEIAVFEACGITNEWDSSAICVSTILLAALREGPDLRRDTLDGTLAAVAAAKLRLARPAYSAVARSIIYDHSDGKVPASLYLAVLAGQTDPANLPLFAVLLRDVHSLDTPTTRVFQTHTLGSERFRAAYGEPAPLERESYLARYDLPLLTPENRQRLLGWMDTDHGAAIFTARPSLPPADAPVEPGSGYAPEAELAAELLGLAGSLPLIAQGRIVWIARRTGHTVPQYIKPAPVQALAAIGAAASGAESAALESAAALYERGELTGPLAGLADRPARVIVLDDAITGIHAVRAAVERLREAGLDVMFEGIGVSPQADKRAALAQIAGRVVDDVNEGLALILD